MRTSAASIQRPCCVIVNYLMICEREQQWCRYTPPVRSRALYRKTTCLPVVQRVENNDESHYCQLLVSYQRRSLVMQIVVGLVALVAVANMITSLCIATPQTYMVGWDGGAEGAVDFAACLPIAVCFHGMGAWSRVTTLDHVSL